MMEGLTTIIFCAFVLLLLLKYLISYEEKSGLPGPKRYPFVGSALQLKKGQIHTQFLDFADKYGEIFEIKLFNTTTVLLNTGEMATKALCADGYKNIFNDRPDAYIAEEIYHRNIITFTNPGQLHSDLRKALSRGLRSFGNGIPEFEALAADEIHRVIDEIETLDGREFEIVSLTKRFLCNIITLLLIGERATEADVQNTWDVIDGQDFFLEPLKNTILLYFPCLIYLPFFKKRFDKIMLAMRNITEKYFFKMKESRKPGQIRGLVDCYLQEQEKGEITPLMSDDVIVAAIIEIITAGLISTASFLPTAILCLARHPEYQTKVQEELDSVIGTDREPSVNDRQMCPFLEAVVIETMRYKPGGPFSLPRVCNQDTTFEGYKVKANTEVLMNLWAINHDEKIYGDPWVFRPERFLDENGKLLANDHPYMKSWQVFGIGRRKCPGVTFGMSRVFLFLSYLFQKWTFLPSPGKCGSCDPRSEDYECELQIKPKPFYCVVQQRN